MKAFVFLALLGSAYAAQDFALQCMAKSERGSCNLDLPRWWYHSDAQRCKLFFYSGCGGNANLYKTKEQCEKTCTNLKAIGIAQQNSEVVDELPAGILHEVCLRPPHRGPCLGSLERFYYDNDNGTCKPFVYGGCGSNGNNFETKFDCMKTCNERLSP
ncbi:boophilin-H2 [Rhipicephalus sanguineus]|nr:boophilin-H2 [Rhipicephalus sanguineus]